MKRLALFLLIGLASAGLTAVIAYDHFTGHMPWATPEPANVIDTSIHSDILNEDRELTIRLPRNYKPDTKYPVMYVLDGGSQDARMANTAEILAAAGYAPEVIVVGIPNM